MTIKQKLLRNRYKKKKKKTSVYKDARLVLLKKLV